MTDKITYYTNKNDARDAFLMDVHIHRQLIKQAYDVYGGPFCKAINADEEEVLQRVIRHDLSKINEDVEAKGLIAYYYRYPEPNLELESPRRRYMYQKSILNHYHVNSNHPEHWLKYHDGTLIAVEMDNESNVEMVLDWIAIGWENHEFKPVVEYWDEVRFQKLFHENTIKKTDKLIEVFKSIPKHKIDRSAFS